MHRTFAAWLIERPWRAAVASALCGALAPEMPLPFAVAAGAIAVLVMQRYGFAAALAAAASASLAAGLVVLSITAPNVWLVLAIGVVFISPVLLAYVLQSTGSLNLTFQVAVLSAGALLLGVHVAVPDPIAMWTTLLRQVLDSMATAGLQLQGDQDEIVALWARTMWGALTALALAVVFGGVLLGRWWWSLLQAPGQFGAEYRQLRLGAILGLAISVVFLFAVLSDSALASSLAWVAFAALTFQGLSAAHRQKAGGRLNRGWLAAIYVALIVPLSMSVTVFILAVWGFADNWARQRAQRA